MKLIQYPIIEMGTPDDSEWINVILNNLDLDLNYH